MTCESLACCGGANVVVKGSFLDLDDQCLMRQYRKLRRVMSDSILVGVLDVPEVYEPGRFSNDVEKARPKAQQTPPEQATCSCVQLRCSYGAVTCSFHQLPLSFLPHVVFAALCSICNSQIPAGETQEKTPAATQPKTSRSQVINADPLHNGQSMRKHPTLLVLCVRVPQLTEWPRGLLKARLHL